MSDTQETNTEKEMTLVEALLPALIVWLKTVFYFIILPYKIWKATTFRLASLADSAIVSDNEEFPMYTFTKMSYDASIFIFGILTILVSVIGLFSQGIEGVFIGLSFYIMIPLISFFKEIIKITLGIIKRLEAIEKNTKK